MGYVYFGTTINTQWSWLLLPTSKHSGPLQIHVRDKICSVSLYKYSNMDFFGDNSEVLNRQRQGDQGGGQEGDPFGFPSYQSPYSWQPVDADSQAMYQEYMEREWARQQAATGVVINEPTNDDVYRPQVEAVPQDYEQHGNVGGSEQQEDEERREQEEDEEESEEEEEEPDQNIPKKKRSSKIKYEVDVIGK